MNWVPKITDFGLAKLQESAQEDTRTSVVLGSPLYMAPEQAEGRLTQVGPATDVYSLGAILYELLTGRPPFEGGTVLEVLDRVRAHEPTPPRQVRPDIPRDLETVCLKCLNKQTADRYASAAALAADLRRFLGGEPVQARPISLRARAWSWARRPERIRDAGLLTIALHLAIAIWTVSNTMLLVFVFDIPTTLADWRQTLALLLGLHGPFLWIGRQTLKRKPVAIWAGTIISGLLVAFVVANWTGVATPFGEFYKDDMLRWQVFGLLSFLFGSQLLAYVLALIAHYASRPSPTPGQAHSL